MRCLTISRRRMMIPRSAEKLMQSMRMNTKTKTISSRVHPGKL
jgi:hypothetical protein